MIITLAEAGSSARMVDITHEYYDRSGYSDIGEFDYDRWCQIWENFIEDEWKRAWLIQDEEEILGFCMAQISWEFIKDALLGDVYQFYISDKIFGDGASRELSAVTDQWFYDMGCKANFVSCAAAMGEKNNSLFTNLWGKLGYCKLGTEMLKLVER